MPMGGGYPPYYAPQMMPLYMNRFKKKFPTKKIPNVTKAEGEEKNEKGNAEDNKVIQEGTQELINKEENKDGNQATEEQKQNQIDVESFNVEGDMICINYKKDKRPDPKVIHVGDRIIDPGDGFLAVRLTQKKEEICALLNARVQAVTDSK